MLKTIKQLFLASLVLLSVGWQVQAEQVTQTADKAKTQTTSEQTDGKTRVVFLGTGHPGFDKDRAGQAILVVVDKDLFLFDAGPGFMKNFNAFSHVDWLPKDKLFSDDSIYGSINKLFLTHLDSDHVLGLDEFLLRPWVQGRANPVKIVGPKGTQKMVDNTLAAYHKDINHRVTGSQPANPKGYKAHVEEISDNQVVFDNGKVVVSAFKVPHGSWADGMAFGYRIKTPTKNIVISGDTRFDETLFDRYRDADILIHEVMSTEGVSRLSPNWQKYMYHAHTSSEQVAALANAVKPKKLILNHAIFFGVSKEALMKEVSNHYLGETILAEDLMVID